jgi:hypothetical protein
MKTLPNQKRRRQSKLGCAAAAALLFAPTALPGQTLIWTETSGTWSTRSIKSMPLGGGAATTVWPSTGSDVTLDAANQRLFWSVGTSVRQGAADGSGVSNLVYNHSNSLQRVDHVFDGAEHWVYWSCPSLQQLGRTRVSDTFTQLLPHNYLGFAIDDRPNKLHLYTYSGQTQSVQRSALDGTGTVTLASMPNGASPQSMVVDTQWDVLWMLGKTAAKPNPDHFWIKRIALGTGIITTRMESGFTPLGQQLNWQDIGVDCLTGQLIWSAWGETPYRSRMYRASRISGAATEALIAPSGEAIEGLVVDPGTNCLPGSPPSGGDHGRGCLFDASSVYFDSVPPPLLSFSSLSFLWLGAHYFVVKDGPTSFVPPSGAAVSLGLGDDSVVSLTLPMPLPFPGGVATTLEVCSNGFVSPNGTSGAGYLPSAQRFLSASPRWALWRDFAPQLGGDVVAETIGTTTYVTWNGVPNFAGPGTSTFQFQFDSAAGSVHLVCQAMSGSGSCLVGWSPGGGALDGGSADWATFTSLALPASDIRPLQLSLQSAAQLGQTAVLATTQALPGSLGINFLSLGGIMPGIELTFLGMPGCSAYVDTSLSVTNLISDFLPGVGMTTIVAIPSNTSLVGTSVLSQSAWFDPTANAAGLVTSNAVQFTITP